MCIRDSNIGDTIKFVSLNPFKIVVTGRIKHFISAFGEHVICLLYTSDAADERSSVDLGGRRIIKKKKI